MKIYSSKFITSNNRADTLPPGNIPEYAFIGRSNVGKSSLINMLTDNKKLAKTSSTPGKTQLINHFKINDSWYLVDLPGYGYAKTSKQNRKHFQKLITDYLTTRKNLVNTFVLVDARHEPQKIDLAFMEWMGKKRIPFAIVFTKADKLSSNQLNKNIKKYKQKLLQQWESLPKTFITSAVDKRGKIDILHYIDELNKLIGDKIKKLK